MTRKTNARLAGFMFLFYIATGLTNLVLFNQAASGEGTAAKLASIAQHATTVRLTVLLTLCGFVSAVVLGVTLYALTRDEDRDLALLALCCRVTEGVLAAVSVVRTLQLLAVATASTAVAAPDAAAAHALGALMLNQGGWTGSITAIFFVMGSTLFSYLFLRARSIPVPLAWLGVLASVLLVVALPLGLVGVIRVPFLLWIPMLVFEVAFALWLIIKGVKMPASRSGTVGG
ncbi:MAG TPA: DUF4386 domain-containing protein [Pyrinomonadaceae bacterium]|nr:DUF4386 domain-containing protein [Pyrinomonadaceae bacterium]